MEPVLEWQAGRDGFDGCYGGDAKGILARLHKGRTFAAFHFAACKHSELGRTTYPLDRPVYYPARRAGGLYDRSFTSPAPQEARAKKRHPAEPQPYADPEMQARADAEHARVAAIIEESKPELERGMRAAAPQTRARRAA